MLDQFTYEAYRQLLQTIRAGRENVCFADVRDAAPDSFFLLRHDIDYSIEAALRMAELEAEAGIRATYFLQVTGDHYNLMAERACATPRRLLELGHEVGLHYDVAAMAKRSQGDFMRQLDIEITVLEALTGRQVRSIAMHNPSVHGDDPFATDRRFVNAYDQRFTRDIDYYSDSSGAWRDKTYHALAGPESPRCFQLLIHPFFWSAAPGTRWDRLGEWINDRKARLDERHDQIRQRWLNHTGVREHDNRQARHHRS